MKGQWASIRICFSAKIRSLLPELTKACLLMTFSTNTRLMSFFKCTWKERWWQECEDKVEILTDGSLFILAWTLWRIKHHLITQLWKAVAEKYISVTCDMLSLRVFDIGLGLKASLWMSQSRLRIGSIFTALSLPQTQRTLDDFNIIVVIGWKTFIHSVQ